MILCIPFIVLCLVLPQILKRIHREKVHMLLVRQLGQALMQMAHALRIGVSFSQAFDYAAREGETPLSEHWRRVLQRVQLGTSWSEALAELPGHVPISEMKWFVAVVEVTRKSGGPLGDVFENLAETIQERQALSDKVSALTAQGKASGMVLAALPFVLLGVLRLLVPDLVRPLFVTSTGQWLIVGMMVSISIGGLVIWKIVHIPLR